MLQKGTKSTLVLFIWQVVLGAGNIEICNACFLFYHTK